MKFKWDAGTNQSINPADKAEMQIEASAGRILSCTRSALRHEGAIQNPVLV